MINGCSKGNRKEGCNLCLRLVYQACSHAFQELGNRLDNYPECHVGPVHTEAEMLQITGEKMGGPGSQSRLENLPVFLRQPLGIEGRGTGRIYRYTREEAIKDRQCGGALHRHVSPHFGHHVIAGEEGPVATGTKVNDHCRLSGWVVGRGEEDVSVEEKPYQRFSPRRTMMASRSSSVSLSASSHWAICSSE